MRGTPLELLKQRARYRNKCASGHALVSFFCQVHLSRVRRPLGAARSALVRSAFQPHAGKADGLVRHQPSRVLMSRNPMVVRIARKRARKVVVSIFGNPTQFAPTEDFGSFPRTWKTDVENLAAERVDLI